MFVWFTWLQFGIGIAVGLFALIAAFANRKPNDYTAGGVVIVAILTIIQLIVALLAPLFGNSIQGDGLEFWMYMVTAVIIPPAAIVWALIERSRWSNAVLGVAALSIAVMVFRMQQIWQDSSPFISA
ncbi:MAG: hypothetical protein ACTHXA_01230 [Gulosibacter sp.]|uniref:hypothetical protein n=1 Tax=Gulosibacter sp. TaxID=2817531 RepID=UPI003F9266E5